MKPEAITVSTGRNHTSALTAAGGARCWGLEAFYFERLGWASYGLARPVVVTGLTSEVATLSAGSSHTCAVTTEGKGQRPAGVSKPKLRVQSNRIGKVF